MEIKSITTSQLRYVMKCLANDENFEPTDDQVRKSKSNLSKYLKLDMIKNKDLTNPKYSGLKLNQGVVVFSHPLNNSLQKIGRSVFGWRSEPRASAHAEGSDHSINTKDYLIREIID